MTSQEKKQLQIIACKVRMGIIEGTHAAKCGHPGGSMSAAEMFTYLYHKEMNVDPQNPKWEDRDRFVLSKGHAAPVYYAALAERGFFPKEWLTTLRKIDSPLQGHPDRKKVPGVDMSTGSLARAFLQLPVWHALPRRKTRISASTASSVTAKHRRAKCGRL